MQAILRQSVTTIVTQIESPVDLFPAALCVVGRSGSFHPDITISGLSGQDQVGWRTTLWFNLYKLKQNTDGSGYWDYYTKIPEESCRGGFALHLGGTSL